MIIISLHLSLRLLETNVVEARKRSAVNIADCVVGHQEVLLPTHEHKIGLL